MYRDILSVGMEAGTCGRHVYSRYNGAIELCKIKRKEADLTFLQYPILDYEKDSIGFDSRAMLSSH